jgi:hypothetical protein
LHTAQGRGAAYDGVLPATVMALPCAFCSHANPPDAKFCNECGNTLRLRPCARCDAVNDIQSSQCHFCGAQLDEGLRSAGVHADERGDPVRRDESPALDMKSTAVDTKSTAVDSKSTAVDTKSTPVDTKSRAVDTQSPAVDSGTPQLQAAETPVPPSETRDPSASTSTTPGRRSKTPAANRWARPTPILPRARPVQNQMASEIPHRSNVIGPPSEREATSVIRAVERTAGSTIAFSTASAPDEPQPLGANRPPTHGGVPSHLQRSLADEADGSPADAGSHLAASFEASRVDRRTPISRAATAIVLVVATSLVALEGFRRVSHIDRWADVPGIATVSSALRLPFLKGSEAPGRVQPITTAQPNVVQDALQSASTRPSSSAADSAKSEAPLPRVPVVTSEEPPANLKVDAGAAPSTPTPSASTPPTTSAGASSPDAATARAASSAPKNEPTGSSAARKPRSASTIASNKTVVDKGAARARRTDSTGVVTSSAARDAAPATVTPPLDARSTPASNAAPCTQSVAALGLCNR